MMTGPGQTAHERLTALARWRRRDTSAAGLMPAAMRERLHREVARQSGTGSGFPEPVPIPAMAAWWRRWRAFAGWVGVGLGAVGVLALMTRLGQDGSPRNRPFRGDLENSVLRPEAEAAGAPSRVGAAPLSAPLGLDAPISAPIAAAPALVAVEAGTGVSPGIRADSSAAKQMRNLDGVVRLRRRYLAVGDSNAAPAAAVMLRGFEVVRLSDRVEFRDDDGSIYVGRVEDRLVAMEGGEKGWAFEGRGTNVASGKVVWITGLFGPVREPQDSRVERFMEMPFAGTAVVGETQVVEIRAEPGQ